MQAELLIPEIARLLEDTLGPEQGPIASATEALGRLSSTPGFAYALLAIATGAGKRPPSRPNPVCPIFALVLFDESGL